MRLLLVIDHERDNINPKKSGSYWVGYGLAFQPDPTYLSGLFTWQHSLSCGTKSRFYMDIFCLSCMAFMPPQSHRMHS